MDDPFSVPAVRLSRPDAPGHGADPDRDWAILSPGERERADRMPTSPRRVWIRSRALLREAVAGHLGCPPREVRLARDRHGRPILPDAPGVHISVAHTTGCCAVAVSTAGPVGVDVEWVRPVSLSEGLARRILGPAELEEWQRVAAPDRTRWLLRRWTWKEALLKAEGTGLAGGLRSFRAQHTAAGIRVLSERYGPGRWWVGEIPAGPRHIAAVARDLGEQGRLDEGAPHAAKTARYIA